MKRALPVLAVLLALPAAALAALPQQSGSVDLAAVSDGSVRGTAANEVVRGRIAGAGDFDGDGTGDLALIAGEGTTRTVRVIHGAPGKLSATLQDDKAIAGATGAVIASGSRWLTTVAAAGDVDGDGRGDLVVGSCDPLASDAAAKGNGRAWVVLGRPGTAPVNLDAPGFGGFEIAGASNECLGRDVDGAGDVNGDGKADVILGAHQASGNRGRAVVVFGKADGQPVDAGNLGTGGFDLLGPNELGFAGQFVAGLGDVNGDGRSDVGVGAADADVNGVVPDAGSAWVVFGRSVTQPTTVQLSQIGTGDSTGFRIDGPNVDGARLGPIGAAGDVNADGRRDVVVGARGHNAGGTVSVVFGKATSETVATGALGGQGYQFLSATPGDQLGFEVTGGHDLNGDGVPDVIAGAPGANVGDRVDAGKVLVLFGRPGGGDPVEVGSLGAAGIAILGHRGENVGGQTQDPSLLGFEGWIGLGDVNGDGKADVLASSGGPAALAGGGQDFGVAHVVLGYGTPSFTAPARAALVAGQPVDLLVAADVRRTGSASFAMSPPPPAGLSLNAATGRLTGVPAAGGTTNHTVTMTDLAGSAQRPLTLAIAGTGAAGPPVLSRVRMRPGRFRVSRRPTAISGARRKPAPFGTTVRFALSEPATVRFRFACRGRQRGAFRKACRRLAKRSTITRRVATAGESLFVFTGRIGRRPLARGRYALAMQATDAEGLSSAVVTRRFTVVRR